MNIFFLFPSVKLDMTVNHGIASLCGIIKARGHKVDLYHFSRINEKSLSNAFHSKPYALCLVSSVTNQWQYALQAIASIRRYSDIPVVVGGHHATGSPDLLEKERGIDGACTGEGDLALAGLLENMEKGSDYHSTRNFSFRRNGTVIRNDVEDLVENLDELPLPDYSVFSKKTLLNYPALMFSRGCPYNCTYCCNNSLRNLYRGKGKYIRIKSVGRAITEVENLLSLCSPPVINFDDDTFIKNREWLYAFLDEYKQLTRTPFNCNTRAETIDEELCRKLRDANCNIVSIGIESGSEALRKKILKRKMTNGAIRNAFALLKKYNIKTSSFNMVGMPDETYENYLETVRLNREISPDLMQISIFFPYPGTELGDYAKDRGLIPGSAKISHGYFSESMLEMKQFPGWKIKYAYLFFHYNVLKKRSLIRALYYLFRYNLLKNAVIKNMLRVILRK